MAAEPRTPNWVAKDKAFAMLMGDAYSDAVFVGEPDDPTKFRGHVKLEFWGEEELSIEELGLTGTPKLEGKHIVLDRPDVTHEWFTPDQVSFKWVRTFKTKPAHNVFIWKLNRWQSYDFIYQAPLREVFPNDPWEIVKDKYDKVDGQIVDHIQIHHGDGSMSGRPVYLEGSWVVKHKTKRDHIEGQTNYCSGKLLHIARPTLTDADGKVWLCDISISHGIYSLTVPQDALDNGRYPLRINDTFGYVTAGGSYRSPSSDRQVAVGPWAPAGTGTATQISLHLNATGLGT
jgi:hypothetical protein